MRNYAKARQWLWRGIICLVGSVLVAVVGICTDIVFTYIAIGGMLLTLWCFIKSDIA
jgi:hypothetical protein